MYVENYNENHLVIVLNGGVKTNPLAQTKLFHKKSLVPSAAKAIYSCVNTSHDTECFSSMRYLVPELGTR